MSLVVVVFWVPVPLLACGLSSVAHLEPFQSLLRTGTCFDPVLIFLHHTSVCLSQMNNVSALLFHVEPHFLSLSPLWIMGLVGTTSDNYTATRNYSQGRPFPFLSFPFLSFPFLSFPFLSFPFLSFLFFISLPPSFPLYPSFSLLLYLSISLVLHPVLALRLNPSPKRSSIMFCKTSMLGMNKTWAIKWTGNERQRVCNCIVIITHTHTHTHTHTPHTHTHTHNACQGLQTDRSHVIKRLYTRYWWINITKPVKNMSGLYFTTKYFF